MKIRIVKHRSPETGLMMVAIWAFVNAISLLAPGELFATVQIYKEFFILGISERFVGEIQLIDGATILITLGNLSIPMRSWLCIISCPLWLAFGLITLIGAYQNGIYSAIGMFSVACGLKCLIAAGQWSYVERKADE